jgi:putative membrane protein
MNPLVPFHGGHGAHGWEESSLSVAPILGSFLLLLLLLLALTGFYLWRQGKLTLPTLGRGRSPEEEAKRILAERFARGDINSDEFLERASMLNWAPGTNPLPTKRGKNRG